MRGRVDEIIKIEIIKTKVRSGPDMALLSAVAEVCMITLSGPGESSGRLARLAASGTIKNWSSG